jgi:predicted  nucleic acid-binding Zn-ribbon protein
MEKLSAFINALFFFRSLWLKTDLKTIIDLQQIDIQTDKHRAFMESIPGEIERSKNSFSSVKQELQTVTEQITLNEERRKSLEHAIDTEKESLTKSNLKMLDVKTNKEYTAYLKEIETIEKIISDTEDEVLEVMELIEENNTVKKEKEQAVKKEEEQFNRLKNKKEQELADFRRELSKETVERNRIAQLIENSLLEQYERLRSIRPDLVVVNLKDNVCQGCHMTLRPQVEVEIMKDEEIIFCDYCNRILFIAP